MEKTVYNRRVDNLKEKYKTSVKKICIDAGFSCPNRDGTKGTGGCIFCGEEGSGEQILNRFLSIEDQIKKAIEIDQQKLNHSQKKHQLKNNIENNRSLASDFNQNSLNTSHTTHNKEKDYINKDVKYIAYFQNFTNTYAETSILREVFKPALAEEKVVALSISTRPDCLDEEKVKLLSEMKKIKDIEVELGLQTSSDKTAEALNRQFLSSEFTKAVDLLNKYDIDVVVHIIIGLFDEGFEELKETVKFLNQHNYSGIKIHAQYVTKNTKLAELFYKKLYFPLEKEDYIDKVVYVLTHINPKVVVHRITGDGEKSKLLAPMWAKNKIDVINSIFKSMFYNNLTQGIYFTTNN